jgi:hypothetical protein
VSALTDRIRALPRATRWGLWAGAIVLSYFVAVEPLLDAINTTNAKAADREGALVALARDPLSSQSSDLVLGVKKFGAVELPGDPETRPVAFNRRVVEILAKHNVKNSSSTTRTMPLGNGPLKDAYGESSRIDRQVREIQFDATPEDIAAVVADLESAPEVAAVSRVQLRRGDQQDSAARLLKATISVEAWVAGRKGRTR